MYNAKKDRNTLQKVSVSSKQNSKQQQLQHQQQRSRVPAPLLTPTVSAVMTSSLPYQQKQNNGSFLPEVHTKRLTTSTTTATDRQNMHQNILINKGIGQYSAGALPTTTVARTGAEAKLLTPSIQTPLPVLKSNTKTNNLHLNTNPSQVNAPFMPSSTVATTSVGAAAAAASGIGTSKFDYRRSMGGVLNNPTSKTFTATQRTLTAVGTASAAGTNPAECEVAHAQVAGGSIESKKHRQQQQQYKESIKKRIAETEGDDDFKNNNRNNYNFNSKSPVTASAFAAANRSEQKPSFINIATNAGLTNISNNSNKSLHGNSSVSTRSGGGVEVTAESLNVMRRMKLDDTTIAAATATAPATGNVLVYTNKATNLSSPTTIMTSIGNTNTTAKATATLAAATGSSKDGIGYLRLQNVQNTRVFYPSSSNRTGSASSRHLQNTSYRSFSAMSTSASGVARNAAGGAGGMPTALGMDPGTGTGKYLNDINTNNDVAETNNAIIAATAPRLVAMSTIRHENTNTKSSSGHSNYMNFSHLYGRNNNDENKQQQHQQHQDQVAQKLHQQQKTSERECDHHDNKINSEERTVSPDITAGRVKAQEIKLSLNDKSPSSPLMSPLQHRTMTHNERGTQLARPLPPILLPTTSRTSSAAMHGNGGAGHFERINNYVDSKGAISSRKNNSGSGVITIPQQRHREQIAKAVAVAVLNTGQPKTTAATTTTAADVDMVGTRNFIEKNQKPLVVSNNSTINTNNITKATASFAASNISGSNAVENIITSGGVGSISTNLQQRYNTEVEHQSASINSRIGAGYTHSMTRGEHCNNSGDRGGFDAESTGSRNSRASTSGIAPASSPMVAISKNIVPGIHHSSKPAATATASSPAMGIAAPRSRSGFANTSNTNSNSNDRSTEKALNSIENITSSTARPTTMATTVTASNAFESTATGNGNKSQQARNAAGVSRNIIPTISSTSFDTQIYCEPENSGSIRGSHTLPTSTATVTTSSLATSKYSRTISDTRNVPSRRDATGEGLCGLRNIGNTCFMNSIIQCLSHTTELTRFLKGHQGSRSAVSKDQQILHEFAKLIREMWSANVQSVTPMELKRAFSTKHHMYSDFNQQDAQEFLRFFLDSLHSALNTGVKNDPLYIDDNLSDSKKADLTWEWYTRHENSLIRDLFVGQLKSTLKCTTCSNTSVTFDPFWDLSVSLPSNSRCKLEACLDLFIREEVLDGDEMPTCSKCKTRRKCTKSFTIQRFPKYLVIHLKRFSETRWSKLSNTVEFPTGERELNMGPYAANLSSSVQYSLYAVSNHMGSTSGGHYVALCKHPVSSNWHEFNDSIVSDPIIESHLVSSCAYILFYERA